jgi:hypothetical protein
MKSPDGKNYHVNAHSHNVLVIRKLNDALRINREGGYWKATDGVAALGYDTFAIFRDRIQAFDDFTFNNDPFGEHDFGKVTVDGTAVFWKIDYYSLDEQHHSPDPADPLVTKRYLTVMLAEEY